MSILNSADITEDGYFTADVNNSSRLLVISGFGESGYDSRPLLGLTFGGVPMSVAIQEDTPGGNLKGGVYYLKEADIPVGPSQLVADWDGLLHEPFTGTAYTLSDIDQVSTVSSSDSTGNNTTNTSSITVAAPANSTVIGCIGTNSAATSILEGSTASKSNFSYTIDRNTSVSAHRSATLHYDVVTAASLNLQATSGGATSNKVSSALVAFNSGNIALSDNIDTDNNIDQHQRDVSLNHTLASPLTSVLINNVEHIDLIQNADTELKYIKRCYDAIGSDVTSVILKNGVDTDVTIPSVTVNTTHPYPVPNEAVDSNSMFSGVTVSGSNASFRITSAPTKGTLDLSDPAKYLHDVDASKGGVYTPNAGATGTDSFTFEVHDPDEPVALIRTQSGTVTINIAELGLPISGSAAFSFPNFQFPTLDTTH